VIELWQIDLEFICLKMDDGVADYPLNWVKTRLYCDQFVTIFLFSDKWSQNHR